MKAVVATFNQEKALVGAFSVITNLRIDIFEALVCRVGLTPGIVTKYHIAMTIIREQGDATWPRTQTLPALIRQDRGHVLYRAHIVLVGTPISKLLDMSAQSQDTILLLSI